MTLKDYLNKYDRFAADNGMFLTQVTPVFSIAEMTVGEHHLTARASVTCDHRKIPFCRVEITDAAGALIASGTSLGYRKADAMEFDSLM